MVFAGLALIASPTAVVLAGYHVPTRAALPAAVPVLFPQPMPDGARYPQFIAGRAFTHVVDGDRTVARIAARLGTPPSAVNELNQLPPGARLSAGQELFIDNRHLVPGAMDDGILINLPQRMLYLFREGQLAGAWPVAIGRNDAPTVTGELKVQNLRRNPTWIVPESIKQRWMAEGKPVVERVPPGPGNPLGPYWIGLNRPYYGIHGTNAPGSIYGAVSQGCVRMQVEHVAELFPQVRPGMAVHIIYEPAVLARLPDGTVLLEVHPDYYQRKGRMLEHVRSLAIASGLHGTIDWQRVEDAVQRRVGLPTDVTLRAPAPAELASR